MHCSCSLTYQALLCMLPLQAALQAVAAMNTILQAAPSVADLHKALLVAGTSLADSASQLAVGSLQLADFGAATSLAVLQQAVAAAVLAGTLPELRTGQQAARSRGSKVGWLLAGSPGLCSKVSWIVQCCVTAPAAACISTTPAGCCQSLNQLTHELPALLCRTCRSLWALRWGQRAWHCWSRAWRALCGGGSDGGGVLRTGLQQRAPEPEARAGGAGLLTAAVFRGTLIVMN